MKILVIEDDEFAARALTAILTREYDIVEVARDGEAGWKRIESCNYDLVLLEVMLPKQDGIRLCRQIRAKGLQMPILLLGQDSSHDKANTSWSAANGLAAGADDYVVKPFDQEELVARVRALLQGGEIKGKEIQGKEIRGRETIATSSEASPPVMSPASPEDSTEDSTIREPTKAQILASLNRIWYRIKDRVGEQVGVLEQAVAALEQQKLEQDLRQQAQREAHTLAGSLGTFGLPKGTQLARQIEGALQAQPLSQANAASLRKSVEALRQEIERSYRHAPSLHSSDSMKADSPLLLIVDRDRSLTHQLVAEAPNWGFRAEVADNLTRARDKIFLESPAIVLLDPATALTAAEGLSFLTEFSKQVPLVPVVIFAQRHDLAERLAAARGGGRTFLQKPAPPAQVLETVQRVLQQADRTPLQVMVVDDDLALLTIVRSLLEAWGLKVTTLADPQQFWDVLEAASPDLLILDIEMPQLSGVELCQIVRNDARWGNLPILFLTAHTDPDTVNQVFSTGADDFVSKPIVAPELVTRILNRLERSWLSRRSAIGSAKTTPPPLNPPD